MGTRYEFAAASTASVELWPADVVEEQTGEEVAPDQVALTIAGDEAMVLVGSTEEVRDLAQRITTAVSQEVLRVLSPGEADADLACPDCGADLGLSVRETDHRRGATWNRDGSVTVGKSNSVETLEVDLFCSAGHGSFEMPDIDDYA